MKIRLSAGPLVSAALALALLGLGGCTSPAAPVQTPSASTSASAAPAKVALGYYAGDDPIVYSSVTTFTSYLNAVSAARFEINTAGEVTGKLPNTELIPFDKAHSIHTYAGVYDSAGSGFDGKLAHTAMVTKKDTMIANLVKLAKDGGYDGLNLDFESLEMTDRDAYTAFVTELATQLHAAGLTLILSVPGQAGRRQERRLVVPFDYAAIGKVADLFS